MLLFAELLREHQCMVYSLAYHALGDRAAAEDLTQEVFLALFEHMDEIRSAEHAKAWLLRVAARRSIDEIRKRKYRRGPSLELVDAPAGPWQEQLVLQQQVRGMIARLPAKVRTILILRYQEGMGIAEIAEALEIPVQTVKSRLHRSLNLLRARIFRQVPDVHNARRV
ncbi:MAG: RNA polymerase sigma factor [Bryobacteraceae bacterium]